MSKIKKSMSIFLGLLFVPRRNKESRNRSLTLNQLKKKKKREREREVSGLTMVRQAWPT